jgi:predicted transcriptional regulator
VHSSQNISLSVKSIDLPFLGLRWRSLKTRGSTEIIGLILQAVERKPLTRSGIMYQAILNFKQVTDYTGLLLEGGLLTYEVQNRKYAITERGIQFLNLFRQTSKLLTLGFEHKTANNKEQEHQKQEEVAFH